MTAQPQLERKVRQLDNDVASIYEMLARIELKQGRHDNRFEEIGADLDVLKADVASLKSDVGTLKSDVGSLKSDVGSLKSDMGTVKSDIASLSDRVTEILEILRHR